MICTRGSPVASERESTSSRTSLPVIARTSASCAQPSPSSRLTRSPGASRSTRRIWCAIVAGQDDRSLGQEAGGDKESLHGRLLRGNPQRSFRRKPEELFADAAATEPVAMVPYVAANVVAPV